MSSHLFWSAFVITAKYLGGDSNEGKKFISQIYLAQNIGG